MKHRPSSTHGFALVIALSLMAFMLLLILSITTLVRVETQSANTQLAQLEARMNAQLGAMVALGDLQRYTGPDQRVTARSDILLAPGLSGPAGQQRWTGVWSSKEITNDSFDQKDGLDNRQARWLVSGNETNGLIIDSNIPVSADTVGLATVSTGPGIGSVKDYGGLLDSEGNVIDRDDTVKAPKVEILGDNNTLAGHYAYWVSDEGVKARVNMAEPSWDDYSVEERSYFRTAMAQVADPTAVSNSEGVQLLAGTDSRWKDGAPDPGKISSLKNIPIFTKDDLPSDEFFHDFTVHSSGVLANTKEGGLKRDLSTALINLPNDMKEGGKNSPIFPPANGPSGPGQMNPGGPKWEQLSDYYKLAKDNFAGDSDESIDLRMPTNEQVGFIPVITRSNFFVQGFAERNPAREASGNWCDNTDPGTLPGSDWEDWTNSNSDWYLARGYRYSLGMFPLVTLWNPYDRDMVLGDLGLEFELPKIDIVDGPGSTTSVAAVGQYTSKWNGSPSSAVKRWTVKFVIQGVTLKAGEAVNFSPPTNAFYNASTPTDNLLVARASAPFVNGFFTPAVASTSDAVFWDNPVQLAINSASWSKSRLSLNVSGGQGSLWRQLVMLYSSSDTGTDNQFISGNRIKTIEIHGTGVFKNGWQQPRVILTNRVMGEGPSGDYDLHIDSSGVASSNSNYQDPFGIIKIYDASTNSYITQVKAYGPGTSYFSDFVGPQGDSLQDIKLGSTDYIAGNELCGNGLTGCNPWGAVGAMRFPNVPSRTWANTGSESEIHLFSNMNPTAPVIHKEPNISWDQANASMAELNVYSKGHIKPWENALEVDYYDDHVAAGTDELQARVGFSNKHGDGGSERMVLFEVPGNIPLSIGQLAHANLMNFDVFSVGSTLPAIGNCILGNGNKWNSHTLQTYATPTYAVGNSLASPLLPLTSTEEWFSSVRKPWVSVPAAHYDYSYKLNDALWDGYFFSGITDANPTFPLPNSRLSPSNSISSNSDLTTANRAAANLLLDGAFNINSTSVAAWESVLGAMRDIETLGYSLDPTLRHNFARFNEPQMGVATIGESVPQLSSKDELVAGYRNLTDAQIASLASKIVYEIRLRRNSGTGEGYPFLSLSEFINRSPQSNTQAFALSGALQAAIDKANLNGLESEDTGLWAESAEYPLYYDSGDTPIIDRPKADGMPGAFMQSDLLAKIGAFIQARSDTFTIRSFGSSQEEFGSNEGSRAYYEMVVQRTPSYVDPSDPDYVNDYKIPMQLTDMNEKFGREYQIKSQRWVAADEI